MRIMSYYGDFHDKFISPRRRRVIKDAVVEILPEKDHYESWLDIGTADQKLFRLIYESLDHCSDVQTLDIHPVANPVIKHTVYEFLTYNQWQNIFADLQLKVISLK